MNNEFFDALGMLEKEKGIPVNSILENIKAAIAVAVKKYYNVGDDNILVDIDLNDSKFRVAIVRDIVEEVSDPTCEVSLEEALEKNKRSKVGTKLTTKLDTKQIGRIAAQSGKNLIHQAISEAVKAQMMEQYQSKLNEVVAAVVQKIEPRTGNATVEIDKNEVILFKNDQIPGEALTEGDHIKVYVSDIVNLERRCSIKISRTHRDLVKRLFEQEVPEIFDGSVEVKSISREAGSRTKIAVYSKDENIDPVGACIGPKGIRVARIVAELNGEKIDVVRYSEDAAEFIAQALSPSDVTAVEILPTDVKACKVIVPDNQLSLAIGNKGQNAKLAARLTGFKIDIKSESSVEELEEETLTSETDETKSTADTEITQETPVETAVESAPEATEETLEDSDEEATEEISEDAAEEV